MNFPILLVLSMLVGGVAVAEEEIIRIGRVSFSGQHEILRDIGLIKLENRIKAQTEINSQTINECGDFAGMWIGDCTFNEVATVRDAIEVVQNGCASISLRRGRSRAVHYVIGGHHNSSASYSESENSRWVDEGNQTLHSAFSTSLAWDAARAAGHGGDKFSLDKSGQFTHAHFSKILFWSGETSEVSEEIDTAMTCQYYKF